MEKLDFEVSGKENFYFGFKIIVSALVYAGLFAAVGISIENERPEIMLVMGFYTSLFVLYLLFSQGIMIGYIKGNAVKVGKHQFPNIHDIVQRQSARLGLSQSPDVYIMQSGGILNAFATRFLGSDYIVLYSEILNNAAEKNNETVEFIIGHELGHIQRKHMTKNLITFPSFFFPFLAQAYSRACEYTCDSIGAALSPKGAVSGLVVLAAGKSLAPEVNVAQFMEQTRTETGFWVWIAEKFSTHPNLTKRVAPYFQNTPLVQTKPQITEIQPQASQGDHSRYMPV